MGQVEGDQLGQRVEDLVGQQPAGDVVARDVEQQQVVEAGEEVGGEDGERVVVDEQLLQAARLLEQGGRQNGQVVVREVEGGEGPEVGQAGGGEDGETVAAEEEGGEAGHQGEVAGEEAGDVVVAEVEGGRVT